MHWLKKAAIIAASIVFFLLVGFILNIVGFINGESQGYEMGKIEGSDEGYSQGYDEGEVEGYEQGQVEGYDEGQAEGYAAGRAVAAGEEVLINPSYQEMKDFLEADNTDDNPWVEGEYEGPDLVADINNNAEAQGFRAALVYIEFPKGAYSLLAFETTDKGLIYIEPQDDREVKVEVGVKYWEDNGYGKTDWDDTIKEVVVSW